MTSDRKGLTPNDEGGERMVSVARKGDQAPTDDCSDPADKADYGVTGKPRVACFLEQEPVAVV
jgi:hypothetical protein